MTSTRERALTAAVELLGTSGLRALTHARVDRHAELPPGSTSNWFRTRSALLAGVADWIAREELSEGQPTFELSSADDLVNAVGGLIEFLTGPRRVTTAARLVLFLEASHDQELREALARGRAAMEAAVTATMSRLGARDAGVAAAAVMACSEGMILHRIAREDSSDPRPMLSVVVRGALA